MATYKLTIEYDGTRYSGWQEQGNTDKTVQGKLSKAAREAFGEADLGGAGRTDAGVHAAGQVAHLRLRNRVPLRDLVYGINDGLPPDIHVVDAAQTSENFHARHDAESRIYLYQISRRRAAFAKPYVWWVKDRLDSRAMAAAVDVLVGKHDFTRLSDKRAVNESKLVVMESVELADAEDLILVRLQASHYLWKMVRKIVATLVEIGRGTMTRKDLADLLNPRGEPFRPTAPPSGLFLEAVTYPGEKFERELAPIVSVTSALPTGRRRA